MILNRHLARLLAAVIVMIAATFGASVAQAHEGHAHHHAPAATTAPVHTAAPATKAEASAPVQIASKAVPAVAGRTPATIASLIPAIATEASADDSDDCGHGCNGRCCGTGMACCHIALTSAMPAAVPMLTVSSIVMAPQQTLPTSLAPEALPKPPRTLAA